MMDSSLTPRPGSEKDITEVSGTSSPGSTPGRGTPIAKISNLLGFFV
jgi:hypothetical protein